MDIARPIQPPTWTALALGHARRHPWSALGLVAALATVGILLGHGVVGITGVQSGAVRLALLGGVAGFAATTLGALPALTFRSLPQRIEDSLLGLAAGMMLAASAFSLLLPGLEAGSEILGSKPLGA
ncbi:hypothetical protein [Magnetospirillum sp. SS-4]|uniref:hypothetical protein n=1 Tax=Magnetospirillum sp. SS-4 TaxID=2681465 RepID=UPI001382114A